MMNDKSSLRDLTDFELEILQRMLAYEFDDKTAISDQIANAKVEDDDRRDEYGSISLTTSSDMKASVSTRVPIELEAKDTDGVPIAALIHVVDGFVNELEFYKADGAPIVRMPEPGDFEQKTWEH